jgi:hypothetical protein
LDTARDAEEPRRAARVGHVLAANRVTVDGREFVNGGSCSVAARSSASTRPSASASATVSTPSTGLKRAVIAATGIVDRQDRGA